jgi:hypothetical protein
LGAKLRENTLELADLKKVQARRKRPALLTQKVQVFMHKHLLERIFESTGIIAMPAPMVLLEKFPRLRRLPARMVGMGFKPEHVHSSV